MLLYIVYFFKNTHSIILNLSEIIKINLKIYFYGFIILISIL
ncbi:hypothetical protein CSG_10910 [Campylobacter fetus subsp. venerealis str. 84-112]|uniref:Uncharacterized protein n=1 Tax=Campylobacter fetus subsp. fetus (strain 82-40) TaxID=360106 RepID=A0RPE0_CAMFF|nr:hypothetical protein CFF8240_0901 [Campylobacter fetus subsp. fetus 82-40]CDF65002.1 hypothetical protein CSG_10910 [Campylobacter fetus subsp. venerealis str. 84-112]